MHRHSSRTGIPVTQSENRSKNADTACCLQTHCRIGQADAIIRFTLKHCSYIVQKAPCPLQTGWRKCPCTYLEHFQSCLIHVCRQYDNMYMIKVWQRMYDQHITVKQGRNKSQTASAECLLHVVLAVWPQSKCKRSRSYKSGLLNGLSWTKKCPFVRKSGKLAAVET